ncbi:hypothetical protein ACWF9G_28540 [Nocardia sp. NPDC055029]
MAATVATVAVLTSPPAHATEFMCRDEHTAGVVTGSGPGSTDNGPAAILGFQHVYYVQRSAALARRFLAPEAGGDSDARLQTGIDAVPADTRHCVHIRRLDLTADSHRWQVTVTEYHPTHIAGAYTFAQTVTTRDIDGRALITSIAKS